MERLTHIADFGMEDWEETLFLVPSDPAGAYNILDIARHQGEPEFNEILKNISLRLAAIEDILGDEYDLDRLRELKQADDEGRCVVLPCKVGQKVKVDVRTWGNVWNYKTVENGKFLIGEIVAIIKTKKQTLVKIRVEHNVSWKRPTKRYTASAIGKTVFLTCEEADVALRREQDG